MSDHDTITEAIHKLIDLRDEAAIGPYSVHDDEGLLALRAQDGYSIAIDFDRENAELFVALHRTIDAQLALLRIAADNPDAETGAEIMLAEAILGES